MHSSLSWRALALGLLAAGGIAQVHASPFTLGELHVKATDEDQDNAFGDQIATRIDAKDMQRLETHTVTEALETLSGISTATNARNEGTISLRGFDSRQAPIFIDGIPVYVPYDGYVDLDRFTTADLASIQVAKGMSSMMYGPNTLGGAINLVTRRPTREFEGDVLLGVGSGGLERKHINVGTNQGLWYLQASASEDEADYMPMSDDFTANARENGHKRENSDYKDRKQSLKIGLTPNDTDEYAIGYVRQDGAKGNLTSTDTTATARYWRWPYWDKESYYAIVDKALTDHESLRIRAFADHYSNGLDTYSNATYSAITSVSNYDDHSLGGSIQLQSTRLQANTIKVQYYTKQDRHEEDDGSVVTKRLKDRMTSIAIEDTIELAPRWSLALGASRDTLTPQDADVYAKPDEQSANNYQGALYFDLTPAHRLYASIARKSRLPTLKDRYSLRFNTFVANPNLKPEQATHYEVGYQGQPWTGGHLEAALFQSDIEDLIQRVTVSTTPTLYQMQNINKARHRGAELTLRQTFGEGLETGVAYTYLERRNLSSDTRLVDSPRNKLNAWADWQVVPRLNLIASLEYADQRWSSDTTRVDSFTTGNLKAALQIYAGLSVEAGVNNITDENYELAYGYPEAGRTYFTNLRYSF